MRQRLTGFLQWFAPVSVLYSILFRRIYKMIATPSFTEEIRLDSIGALYEIPLPDHELANEIFQKLKI